MVKKYININLVWVDNNPMHLNIGKRRFKQTHFILLFFPDTINGRSKQIKMFRTYNEAHQSFPTTVSNQNGKYIEADVDDFPFPMARNLYFKDCLFFTGLIINLGSGH